VCVCEREREREREREDKKKEKEKGKGKGKRERREEREGKRERGARESHLGCQPAAALQTPPRHLIAAGPHDHRVGGVLVLATRLRKLFRGVEQKVDAIFHSRPGQQGGSRVSGVWIASTRSMPYSTTNLGTHEHFR